MLQIRRDTPVKPARPTHVLHWSPAFGDECGYWTLQDADDYDAGLRPDGCPETFDPVDTDRGTLTAWVAGQAGSPVVLEPGGEAGITSVSLRPPFVNRGKSPVWYVWPAQR